MSRMLKWTGNLLFITALVALVGSVFYRQDITDHLKVNSFEPSAAISQLATDSKMSDTGRFYFFVTHPELKTAKQFNEVCQRVEQASPILGCYDQVNDRIYVYNISNQELDGIKEITASHEMLHAAFTRLDEKEVKTLSAQLELAYQKVADDDLKERIDYYDRTAPGSRINELHSILGTEFLDIGSDLEKYYSKYFSNRTELVELHQSYQQKFKDIERESEALLASLETLKTRIDGLTAQYHQDVDAINQRVQQFNDRAKSGGFNSQSEFDRTKNQLNSEITRLDLTKVEITRLIDKYNSDANRINELGGKMDELNQGIDSLRSVDGNVQEA